MDEVYDVVKEILMAKHGATLKKQQAQAGILAGIVAAIMNFLKAIAAFFMPKKAVA